jgi:hypothetical protein
MKATPSLFAKGEFDTSSTVCFNFEKLELSKPWNIIIIIINFHTHINYLAQIKYLYELVLWILDNG